MREGLLLEVFAEINVVLPIVRTSYTFRCRDLRFTVYLTYVSVALARSVTW